MMHGQKNIKLISCHYWCLWQGSRYAPCLMAVLMYRNMYTYTDTKCRTMTATYSDDWAILRFSKTLS